jgi:hypothetical protein
MTDKAISPLRRRLIEDITIRRLSPKTSQNNAHILAKCDVRCSLEALLAPLFWLR